MLRAALLLRRLRCSLPWLLLVFGLISALFTRNAWRPFRFHPLIGMASFFPGWLVSELPFHHILWQLGVVTVLALLGALSTPVGLVGLGLCAASWGGLLACHVQALSTQEAVDKAITEGLGEGVLPPPARLNLTRLAMPRPSVGRDVTRVRDLVYHDVDGLKLKLDIYHHTEKPSARPVLLQVHGGAWVIGTKDEQGLPLMHRMAHDGWICVAINYRLSPRFTFPDPIVDIKRAIAWIHDNIGEYGGDPDFIAITGGSAGGHLCALAALSQSDPAFQPGFESVDTSLKACVPFYGIYDLTNDGRVWAPMGLPRLMERYVIKASVEDARETYVAASPYCRADENAPPFMIFQGTSDTLVPLKEARRFTKLLRDVSREAVCYVEVPGAQHAFEIFPSVRAEIAVDGAARFLHWTWENHQTSQAGQELA